MGGNQGYDSFVQSQSYIGIVKAIPLVRSSLGSLSYEESITVFFNAQVWILVLKWSSRNTAMYFVALRIVIAPVFIASSYSKLPGQKVCCLRGKTRHSSSCRGSIIAFNTEITQVAEVEPGNVVWMPISAIRKRSNIWSCLLPSHSSPLSDTPICTRLYKLFDKAGKSEACYQPGTLWCTSCWRNADKTFASRTTLL